MRKYEVVETFRSIGMKSRVPHLFFLSSARFGLINFFYLHKVLAIFGYAFEVAKTALDNARSIDLHKFHPQSFYVDDKIETLSSDDREVLKPHEKSSLG